MEEGRPAGRPIEAKGRRAAAVVAANVVGVVGLFLALEGAVRVTQPEVGPIGTEAALLLDSAFVDAQGASTGLRPGAAGIANGERVRVDAGGFHIYAGTAGGPRPTPPWLWLGDSVTFGVGVPADSTVAGRLAAMQDTARVRNPAVIGWDTGDYRRRLDAALADGLAPGRVTVLWCLNDAVPRHHGAQRFGASTGGMGDRARVWLNRHSRLYRFAKDLALDRPLRYLEFDRRAYAPLADGEVEEAPIEAALADLRAMRDTLRARSVPFEVVVAPYEPQLRPGAAEPVQRALVARLRALGIPTLDLFEPFAEAAGDDPSALYLWSDGIHLSARGHAVAARAIADWTPAR